MSADDIERMNETFSFIPVSNDIKQKLYSESKEYLTGKEMNLRTCAVCDVLKRKKNLYLKYRTHVIVDAEID